MIESLLKEEPESSVAKQNNPPYIVIICVAERAHWREAAERRRNWTQLQVEARLTNETDDPFIMSRLVAHDLLHSSSTGCRISFSSLASSPPTDGMDEEKEQNAGVASYTLLSSTNAKGGGKAKLNERSEKRTAIMFHVLPVACSTESKLVRVRTSKKFVQTK